MDTEELDPEFTGPPIGTPPEHVHSNEPVVESIEDTADEVDELVQQVRDLETVTGERHTEILGRLESCQTALTKLSTALDTQPVNESPMLLQIVSQLSQVQAELQNQRLLLDTLLRNPSQSVSPISSETLTESGVPEQELSTEEVPEEDAQGTPPERLPKRRRFR